MQLRLDKPISAPAALRSAEKEGRSALHVVRHFALADHGPSSSYLLTRISFDSYLADDGDRDRPACETCETDAFLLPLLLLLLPLPGGDTVA